MEPGLTRCSVTFIYKIYTESFLGKDHLKKIQGEARQIVADALA